MAPHDPLFKSLLRTFFGDFLRLVAPKMAERLDLSAPVFLDKELTAFDPPARSRLVDLLARVPLREMPGRSLLVHTEVENRARRGIGERIRSYQRWIQTRHDGQILSVALFLHGGRAGICEEAIDGELAGPGLPVFRYLSFGLSRCRAAEYLEKPEPLAWALAALMDRRPWSRAEDALPRPHRGSSPGRGRAPGAGQLRRNLHTIDVLRGQGFAPSRHFGVSEELLHASKSTVQNELAG
jgi:hypothetical protein